MENLRLLKINKLKLNPDKTEVLLVEFNSAVGSYTNPTSFG